MWKWVNVGKWQDFLNGKKQIILYANTIDMIRHIEIVNNYQKED